MTSTRTKQVNFRLSPDEFAAITAAALKAGMSPAEWIRVVTLSAAGGVLAKQLKRAREAADPR